eukprot:3369019-Rhodomonas_salina.1
MDWSSGPPGRRPAICVADASTLQCVVDSTGTVAGLVVWSRALRRCDAPQLSAMENGGRRHLRAAWS